MKYSWRIDEYSKDTGHFIRSVNAYTSRKRAETACERLNAEDAFDGNRKEYIVCEA